MANPGPIGKIIIFRAGKVSFFWWLQPWKINMEPEIHLFEKESHLPNLHFLGSKC